jgi:hypothetical protein
MKNLLDEHKTAETLNVSIRTLQRLRTTGSGPSYLKIGRLVRYDADTVAEYLLTCARQSTSSTEPGPSPVAASPDGGRK